MDLRLISLQYGEKTTAYFKQLILPKKRQQDDLKRIWVGRYCLLLPLKFIRNNQAIDTVLEETATKPIAVKAHEHNETFRPNDDKNPAAEPQDLIDIFPAKVESV